MAFRVTVEVPLFLITFAFMLTASVNTNLMIYRTCYVTLGIDKQNCSMLGNTHNNITSELEKQVQPIADVISMVKTIVDSVSTAILSLFVGAWSDRFGRKPVMVLSLIGAILMNVVMVIFSALENLSPWYMMMCSVPIILTGGGASLSTFSAYLTDITSQEVRGLRMGIFEGVLAAAVFSGNSISSYVFNATSYVAVFSIATAGCFLALIYTLWFLPESLEVIEDSNRIKGFFQLRNMTGMFRTSFRNRPHYNRAIILLVMFALSMYFMVIGGDGSVMFLFMREKFNWTLKQYTWYGSATNIMWIAGTFFIISIVHHKLHVRESTIILVGFVSMMIGAVIQGLAQVDWLIYAAAVVRMPSGGSSPMTRSLLSKLVNNDESGKIFALFSLTQNILGLVGSPVYTTLYNATLDTDPGIFNFLTAGGHVVNMICLSIVLILQNRTAGDNYSILVTDNEDEQQPKRTVDDDDRTLVVNS